MTTVHRGPVDERLMITLTAAELSALDDWRRQQPDPPSRSEAIRRLVKIGISSELKPRTGK